MPGQPHAAAPVTSQALDGLPEGITHLVAVSVFAS